MLCLELDFLKGSGEFLPSADFNPLCVGQKEFGTLFYHGFGLKNLQYGPTPYRFSV